MDDNIAEISQYSKSELDAMTIGKWAAEAELCIVKARERKAAQEEAEKRAGRR